MTDDVEAQTIQYEEELRAVRYPKILSWMARKIAELEAKVDQLSEEFDPEATTLVEHDVRAQLEDDKRLKEDMTKVRNLSRGNTE